MQSLPFVLAILVGGAVASGFTVLFLRARLRERAEPDPSAAPSSVAQEIKAIGDQIGQAMAEQRLQGETQRQLLAQKLDGVRQSVESQRSHVDGLRNELRHEVRRRDAELEEIRSRLGSIQSAAALPPAGRPLLPPAPLAVDAPPETSAPPVSDDAEPFWTDAPAAETDLDAEPEAHQPAESPAPVEAEPPAELPALARLADAAPHDVDGDPDGPDAFLDSFADVPSGDSIPAPLAPPLADAETPAPEAAAEDVAETPADAPPATEPSLADEPFEDEPFEDAAPDALAQDVSVEDYAPAFKTFSPEELVSDEDDRSVDGPSEAPDALVFAASASDLPTAPAPTPPAPLAASPEPTQSFFEDVSFDGSSFENLPFGDDLASSPASGYAAFDVGPEQAPTWSPASASNLEPPRSLFEAAPGDPVWIARSERPSPLGATPPPAHAPFSAPPFLVPGEDAAMFADPNADAAASATPEDADDLTVIRAIDEQVQERLYAEGVTSLEAIAQWDRADARQFAARVHVSEETIMTQWVFEAQAALFNQFAGQTGA